LRPSRCPATSQVQVRPVLHQASELPAGPSADPAFLLDHLPGGVGAPRGKAVNGRVRVGAWPVGVRAPRLGRRSRRALLVLALLGAVAVSLPLGAHGLGRWLVVADPLGPARAVVVLSGRVPFRAIEAAAIYRGGLAPEVWLTKEFRSAEELAL